MAKALKEFEMSVTGISSDEWDKQALEAQEARAAIRAEYEAELMIGCEEAPRICYGGRGKDTELYGVPHSTLDRQANRAYTIEW